MAQVAVAQADDARGRVVEPEEQPRHGRLAAAGATQQAEDLARLQLERDVMQDRLVVLIAEGHFVEGDRQRSPATIAPARPRRWSARWPSVH